MSPLVRAVAILALAMSFVPTANAHEARPGYLEIQQTGPDTYDLLWKVPARGDLRLSLNVVLPPDCLTLVEPTRARFDNAFIDRWSVQCPGGLEGLPIAISGLRGTMTDVLCRIIRRDGSTETVRLAPSAPSFVFGASPGWTSVARAYLGLGIEHILGGPDHLLFIACLVMLTGWSRRLLITITGFTLAHSVTLALATLGFVEVRIAAAEAVIALSVVFVASEIARGRRDSLTYRHPVVVSSVFGLLHGFGFAAVLHQIGLPDSAIPTALLFFNVGVELGQIFFVFALAIAIAALRWLVSLARSTETWTARLSPAMSLVTAYAIGTMATFWFLQRLQGI